MVIVCPTCKPLAVEVMAVATPPVRLRELMAMGVDENPAAAANEIPLVHRGSVGEGGRTCGPAWIARFVDVGVQPAGRKAGGGIANHDAGVARVHTAIYVGVGGEKSSRPAPLKIDIIEQRPTCFHHHRSDRCLGKWYPTACRTYIERD